jgi:hypothetical protein
MSFPRVSKMLHLYSNLPPPTSRRSLSKDWNKYEPEADTVNKVPYLLEFFYNPEVYTKLKQRIEQFPSILQYTQQLVGGGRLLYGHLLSICSHLSWIRTPTVLASCSSESLLLPHLRYRTVTTAFSSRRPYS